MCHSFQATLLHADLVLCNVLSALPVTGNSNGIHGVLICDCFAKASLDRPMWA